MNKPWKPALIVSALSAVASFAILDLELFALWPAIAPGRIAALALLNLAEPGTHAMLPWFVLISATNALVYGFLVGATCWIFSRLARSQKAG